MRDFAFSVRLLLGRTFLLATKEIGGVSDMIDKAIEKGVEKSVEALGKQVSKTVNAVQDHMSKVAEEQRRLITVPDLCVKGYPLTIEQATEQLNGCDLNATLVVASIKDANPKYRTCFPSQVIGSHPKANQKVEPGSYIKVKYITQEVIDESQRLFEKAEKEKEKKQYDRAEKLSEQKEKAKQAATGAIDTAKKMMDKIPPIPRKKKRIDDEQLFKND